MDYSELVEKWQNHFGDLNPFGLSSAILEQLASVASSEKRSWSSGDEIPFWVNSVIDERHELPWSRERDQHGCITTNWIMVEFFPEKDLLQMFGPVREAEKTTNCGKDCELPDGHHGPCATLGEFEGRSQEVAESIDYKLLAQSYLETIRITKRILEETMGTMQTVMGQKTVNNKLYVKIGESLEKAAKTSRMLSDLTGHTP